MNFAKFDNFCKKGLYHYTDVMVTCDERDLTSRKIVQFPCLIVEVLSDGTEAYDRGTKFRHYRRLKTLKEYILIDAEKICVECYRINESIVIFEIPKAANMPVSFKWIDYIRVGSYKKKLKEFPEKERELWALFSLKPFDI